MTDGRDRLKTLFRERALQFGDFTLASGQKSSYYVNSKRVLFHAEAITLLGEQLADAVADVPFDAIGGLEVGAIPMAAAALTALHRKGNRPRAFSFASRPRATAARNDSKGWSNPATVSLSLMTC